MGKKRAPGEPFHSRAFLQRSRDAVFLLNRKRRLRFANPAWEQLTNQSLEDAYDLYCTRHRSASPLAQTLSPPPEVLGGSPARVRRPPPKARSAPPWWDIAFLPLSGPDGLYGIIGRITVVGAAPAVKARPMPEGLLQLRQRLSELYQFAHLESQVPECQRVIEQARLAAQNRAPVVLIGEAGTGKYRLARTIHHQGMTAEHGFVAVDALALPPLAQAALLFGDAALGKPEHAGTVYLHHPARLPLDLQARLAGWLQDRPASAPRIIAGFRSDPAAEVAAGRLRADLRIALSIQTLTLPPLRERLEDLPRIVADIFDRCKRAGGSPAVELTPEAMDILHRYPCPGNLRELELALESAAETANGGPIEPGHLPDAIRTAVARVQALDATAAPVPTRQIQLDQVLESVERRLIVRALAKARGDKTKAAETLGIWRDTLLRRLRALKITEDAWCRHD